MQNPKTELKPFKKIQEPFRDDGVVELNKDTTYTFSNSDDTNTNAGTSSSSKY